MFYKSNGHTYLNNALLLLRGVTRTVRVLSLWHQIWEEVKVYGPVIIYRPEGGGRRSFGGDHLTFRRTERGIIRK